ncbi:MAG: MerR family transcriptional regulator [Alphaproteobacteria bacterium]|nr:MerR family transcriptional regulator [Alphaproteobacteria bacterium]MBM3732644.1 MerR family transcriptional regulator [Acidimicrobiia bacterium]
MANPQPVLLPESPPGGKSPEAFRTISEVAAELDLPQHVLRFWETRFAAVRPLKRSGGRRYYRPEDVALLRRIRDLLREKGYTIKGVQKLLRHGGTRAVPDGDGGHAAGAPDAPTASEAAEAAEHFAVAPSADTAANDSKADIPSHTRQELAAVLAELEELRALIKSV